MARLDTRKSEVAIATGWSALVALVLTWPMALRPASAALGSVHADGMKHLWTLWWMRTSVWQEGSVPFDTRLVNWPVGMELYPIEPLNGVLAVLLPFIPVVLLSNLLVLLNMTATGVAGAWFGKELSGSRLGGLVAGTLLEGSAVMAFFVHVGVGELTHLWWIPLGLGVLLRARRTLDWRWFLALTGCLVGAVLSCFYLGFFLGLSVATVALTTLWAGRKTPGLLARYAVAAGLAIAIVYPITQTFSSSYKTGDVPPVGLSAYLLQEHGQPITDPVSARLDPLQLVTPGREATRREDAAYGGGRYLGLLALGLALIGVARDPRKGLPLAAVAVVGVVFALGSYLVVDGELIRAGGARLRMPSLYLNRILGYIAEPLNFPVRFLAITVTGVAGMASLAAAGAGKRWRQAVMLLAPLAVLEIAWGQMLAYPWQSFTPRPAAGLEVLRDQPDKAVVDLSLVLRSDNENRWNALSTQIAHGKPMNAVPVERIEFFARDGVYFIQALQLTRDVKPVFDSQRSSSPLVGDYRADLALLQDAGFGWVLVSHRAGSERLGQGLVDALSGVLGPPVSLGQGLGLWALPEVSYTPEELSAWKASHEAAMDSLRRRTPGMGPQQH